MLSPIFKDKVQGHKQPGISVVIDIKFPLIVATIMSEWPDICCPMFLITGSGRTNFIIHLTNRCKSCLTLTWEYITIFPTHNVHLVDPIHSCLPPIDQRYLRLTVFSLCCCRYHASTYSLSYDTFFHITIFPWNVSYSRTISINTLVSRKADGIQCVNVFPPALISLPGHRPLLLRGCHSWTSGDQPCHIERLTYIVGLGLYSLSGKTSYRKISWSLEAAGFGFKLVQSFWNLAGTSAALLPRCLSNVRAIRLLQHPISRLRDFTKFGGKTSYRLVNRDPGREATFLAECILVLEMVDAYHT